MRLIDCFTDVLAYVVERTAAIRGGEQPAYEELRLGVERRLADHAGDYTAGGYSRPQYDAAKFAVVAFIDEAILLSQWEHKAVWSRELLQKAHFETANAGVEFFDRLDALSPFNPGERDIREVYYYCLCLGFVGKYYRAGDKARLDELRDANFNLLTNGKDAVRSLRDLRLFPDARADAGESKDVVIHKRRAYLYYGVPLLVLLGAFFVFRADVISAAEYLVTVV